MAASGRHGCTAWAREQASVNHQTSNEHEARPRWRSSAASPGQPTRVPSLAQSRLQSRVWCRPPHPQRSTHNAPPKTPHPTTSRLLCHGAHKVARQQLQSRQRAQQRRVLLVQRVHELAGRQPSVRAHTLPGLALRRRRRRGGRWRRRRSGCGAPGWRCLLHGGLLPRPWAAGPGPCSSCVLVGLWEREARRRPAWPWLAPSGHRKSGVGGRRRAAVRLLAGKLSPRRHLSGLLT